MLGNNVLIWKRKIVFSRKFKILNFNPCILEKINNHLKYIGYHMYLFLNRAVWNQCHFPGGFFSGVETLSVCTGEQTGFYPLNRFPGLDKPQIAPIIVHRQSSN